MKCRTVRGMARGRALGLLLVAASALAGCLARTGPENVQPPTEAASSGRPLCADPGQVLLHRLNRAEYNNTVRDLLGDTSRPADDFPQDDSGYGFDNISDVLAIAPLLVDKYQIAAENLVTATLTRSTPGPSWQHFDAAQIANEEGARYKDKGWLLFSPSEISQSVRIAADGEYEISARLFGRQAGTQRVRAELRLDGESLETFEVTAQETQPIVRGQRARMIRGEHRIAIAFSNPFSDPSARDPSARIRGLVVDWLEVGGPFERTSEPDSERRARVMICDPGQPDLPSAPGLSPREACARAIFSTFGRRAWRRPLTTEEVDRLIALASGPWSSGETFDAGVGLGLQGILLSPHFLFRVELSLDPSRPHPLSDLELASRLSYFLWSSAPDDRLLDLAEHGRLHRSEEIAAETRRMLQDPKSEALIDNFGGQWLNTRALADVNPDYALYPDWDHDLQIAMKAETHALLRAFMFGDRSALDMIDADFSFLNARLARHYGEPPISGDELRPVTLSSGQRGGLLTQGSILTVTSHPRRTSPVKRGKWVLEQILCRAPPPPPANVPAFPEEMTPSGSVRQKLEAHRSQPACKACHAVMDPIGFGLEGYDAIGAWRTMDSGFPIDASGELPGGRSFSGARDLARLIKTDPGLPGCIAERMFVYAMGRGPTGSDTCTLDQIAKKFTSDRSRFESLFIGIATSGPFTNRHGEPVEAGGSQ